ncbi:DUF488 domain-containing protein [Rhizobium mesoamericanum]|uniref:DUF488 domain-containing protein n=1 Tax=Rhizobium mesoamericanum STM3625 TaxID=1211777 RepID=K0PKM5_9HYPH|nr:DUF488 family protein [Rhizobium mesoamericanum]CCM77016.1 conserved hypothetical protein [Rhizobium mesoamericanum STM3625]
MAISVVQLGSPRAEGEGVRIGTVRRPPRGVLKEEFASRNFYDVWLPILSPSQALVTAAKAATTDAEWGAFLRSFTKEMKVPEASHVLDLLATFSHASHFSIGCYCENENHCHRSVLRRLLEERGAAFIAEGCA